MSCWVPLPAIELPALPAPTSAGVVELTRGQLASLFAVIHILRTHLELLQTRCSVGADAATP